MNDYLGVKGLLTLALVWKAANAGSRGYLISDDIAVRS